LLITPAVMYPKPILHAPVNVAQSIIDVTPSCFAYVMQSPNTRRPSASVDIISTVCPFIIVMTSPGLYADPEGIFSTHPTTRRIFALGRNRPIASSTPIIVADPPMSFFNISRPDFDFNDMPPVSNVTPFPMRPIVSLESESPSYLTVTTYGSSTLP